MQRRGREHRGPVVADPFEHGGQPELDRLRHALGLQQCDDVAGRVPAHPAPHLRAGDLEPVRAQVLVTVPGRRHDDQPLPQRLHRRVVLVAEALLEDVADAPGRGQVEPAVIEHRRVQHRGVQHHRAPSPGQVLLRLDHHRLQQRAAERGGHGDIGSVPPPADHDTSLAPDVVAGIEGPPLIAQPHFHPGREVHRCRIRRDVEVGQVAEHVAGRDVQRPAERDREVGEVTADPAPRHVDVGRAGQGRRAAVLEGQVVVHVIADGLHPAVPGLQAAEARPGLVAEHVRQAVAARQGVDQGVVGEGVGRALGRILVRLLGLVRHHGDGLVPEAGPARGQHRAQARVAVQVGIAADVHGGLRGPLPALDGNMRGFGGLDLEDHRRADGGDISEVASDQQAGAFP